MLNTLSKIGTAVIGGYVLLIVVALAVMFLTSVPGLMLLTMVGIAIWAYRATRP